MATHHRRQHTARAIATRLPRRRRQHTARAMSTRRRRQHTARAMMARRRRRRQHTARAMALCLPCRRRHHPARAMSTRRRRHHPARAIATRRRRHYRSMAAAINSQEASLSHGGRIDGGPSASLGKAIVACYDTSGSRVDRCRRLGPNGGRPHLVVQRARAFRGDFGMERTTGRIRVCVADGVALLIRIAAQRHPCLGACESRRQDTAYLICTPSHTEAVTARREC